jgi:hypothetical protein
VVHSKRLEPLAQPHGITKRRLEPSATPLEEPEFWRLCMLVVFRNSKHPSHKKITAKYLLFGFVQRNAQ